jgi:hypothetical protein
VFTVPASSRAVLKQFVIEIQAPTTATNVTVSLLRSGNPIIGFQNIAFIPMNAATQALPFNGVDLRFNNNETLSAVFTNNNPGTAWTVGISGSGWSVPQADIDRLSGPIKY